MTYRDQRVLAVVPARGGSKGIPRKNLAEVGGRSLLGHVADVVAELPWLDAVVVSTDDDEIAAAAEAVGLAVPFRRPDDLAGDAASSVDAWRHAWLAAEAWRGTTFDLSVLLEPTSPLRRAGDVMATLDALLDGDHAAAATVSPTPAHFTPHKTLVVDDGIVGFHLDDGARYARRQAIPPYYHRNGACYAVRRATLVDAGHIIEDDCAAVILDRPLVNIDEPFDLALADWLLRTGGTP